MNQLPGQFKIEKEFLGQSRAANVEVSNP